MFLSDPQIAALIREPKPPVDAYLALRELARHDPTDGHRRHSVAVTTGSGKRFRVILRQSALDPFDFSVILLFEAREGGTINLRRHNGPSHPHVNPIEGDEL